MMSVRVLLKHHITDTGLVCDAFLLIYLKTKIAGGSINFHRLSHNNSPGILQTLDFGHQFL